MRTRPANQLFRSSPPTKTARVSRLIFLVAVMTTAVGIGFLHAQSGGAQNPASETPRQLLNEGVKAFGSSDFSTALVKFRELTLHPGDPTFKPYEGDGYFWVGKTAMALNRLSEAERNLEYFLLHYPDHPAFPEASYLKARLLYLQQDYQSAIQAFQDFIAKFPKSPFIANAYYWAGESLYNLGQFEDARKLFMAVIQNFPTSYRVEAAQYRLSLIDQKKREGELLKLLQWSHEESLRALNEFQRKEHTYQEAIAAYQKELAGKGNDELSKEITRLSGQLRELQDTLVAREHTIEQLKQEISDLQAKLQSAGAEKQPEAAQPAQDKTRQTLLDLKQRATSLKQFFESELKSGTGGTK